MIYAVLVIVLVNKCFELIYALPDKILRWLGGQEIPTGVGQVLDQAKGYFDKGTAVVTNITKGAVNKAANTHDTKKAPTNNQ
jgi:hypothetical protein